MASLRQKMLARGYGAEFGDRESELLYIVIREVRPNTVVEISPRHGYSTNFILAALAANEHGTLHSFEIEESVCGVPIEDVIRGNQLASNPQERLVLHIGDARTGDVPAADVLFIDGAHEDHFAAWHFETQIAAAQFVVQHDICIRQGGYYAPKASYLGPRESSLTLEALRRSDRRFFSAAAATTYADGQLGHLTPRGANLDVAVLYEGGPLTPETQALCATTRLIHERRVAAVEGLRDEAINELPNGMGFAERCAYGSLLAEMGYTSGSFFRVANYEEKVRPRIHHQLSSAELVYYISYLMKAGLFVDLVKVMLSRTSICTNHAFARSLRRSGLRSLLGSQ